MKQCLSSLLLLTFVSINASAQSLDEQYGLLLEDRQDQIRCFEPNQPFLYCLQKTEHDGLSLVNQNGEIMYQIYYFDNGPDYAQDGLYRIRLNNKIGYADAITGKVVIPPQYDCAYPFENGQAQVGFGCQKESDGEHSWWVGGEWQRVDLHGKLINPRI